MSHNHRNYQARLDFIQKLFNDHLDFEESPAEITPLQYDPKCPFKYNNFVYLIILRSPTTNQQLQGNGLRYGCVPIPEGTKSFILRFTNSDADGMSSGNRVENEVATLSLASNALAAFQPHVVPSVYAWSTAAGSAQGWILQQHMPGSAILEDYPTMDFKKQRLILAQMANILKALQDYPLPDSITGIGGLTFDSNGRIVSAPMTNVGAGPWSTYEDFFRTRLRIELEKADKSQHIQGWHANGIRKRLDAFLEHGLHAQFESLADKDKRVIAHNDSTADNILIDTDSGRITALLDYDFSCISHPSYEYFCSFLGAGEQLPGWCKDPESEQAKLRQAKLHGFPPPLFPNTDGGINWEIARACEEELEKVNAMRPRTIAGVDRIADVNELLSKILPWRLSNSDILERQSQETIDSYRKTVEGQISELLQHLGY